jgi:N-acetylmuramoyl-L-alanine amidase
MGPVWLARQAVRECTATKDQTPELIQHPSPNFGPRRDGLQPSLVVLHYTAMDSAEAALERLCDPEAEVSAHYLIAGDGRIWQMVPEDQRAWHAGAGRWRGMEDINSRSIGIELDNTGLHPFAAPQVNALEALLAPIMQRWAITPENVIAHSDMAPDRKSDPGPKFDWRRLARQGLSIWPASQDIGPQDGFDSLSLAFGYAPDWSQEARLRAFRDRFRPGAEGPVCDADLQCLSALLSQLKADKGFEV